MSKKYITLEPNQAGIIQEKYGCSDCWNRVNACHDKDGDYLDCGTENCPQHGLVRLSWIERQINDNYFVASTARRILQDSFAWVKVVRAQAPRSIEINLHELGF